MNVDKIMRIRKTEIELWAHNNVLELSMTDDDYKGVSVIMCVAHVVELRNYLNTCIDSLYKDEAQHD